MYGSRLSLFPVMLCSAGRDRDTTEGGVGGYVLGHVITSQPLKGPPRIHPLPCVTENTPPLSTVNQTLQPILGSDNPTLQPGSDDGCESEGSDSAPDLYFTFTLHHSSSSEAGSDVTSEGWVSESELVVRDLVAGDETRWGTCELCLIQGDR